MRAREENNMKIKEITTDSIIFDNGAEITCSHTPENEEINYAEFEKVSPLLKRVEFEAPLIFKSEKDGFRFGDTKLLVMVPCVSIQFQEASTEVDIYYNNTKVLTVNGRVKQ